MNIMIVSGNPKQTSEDLSILYDMQSTNQCYFPPVILLETESAVSPLFDLDLHTNPNKHTIIITDSPDKLWQGAREELLDMIIVINSKESGKWLANLFSGRFAKL